MAVEGDPFVLFVYIRGNGYVFCPELIKCSVSQVTPIIIDPPQQLLKTPMKERGNESNVFLKLSLSSLSKFSPESNQF